MPIHLAETEDTDPDYATTVYTKILKELYPDVPVLIGGIEASLRRVTHFDYWADRLFPSVLEDSGADLLVYGMGEQPLYEIHETFGQRGAIFLIADHSPDGFFGTGRRKTPQK